LNVISYPLHLCRKFERRWIARAVQAESQHSPSQRPEGCTACGKLVAAPAHATYLPTGTLINQWRCPVCKNSWQTSAEPANSTDSQLSRSDHLRNNAGHCLTLEHATADDATRKQLRRMGDAWLSLAETQDWLDGATPALQHQSPNALGVTSSILRYVGFATTEKRNRVRQSDSLAERLAANASRVLERASRLEPGAERELS